jgi:hypothetical protein
MLTCGDAPTAPPSPRDGRCRVLHGAHRRPGRPTLSEPADRRLPWFGEDELGDILEDHGFTRVRITNFGSIQWVRGKR